MGQPITLYYYPGACSLAPLLVLEELGVPFEARLVDLANDVPNKLGYRCALP